jgi:hypothetical protein
LSFTFISGEELEQVLKLAGVLVLEETLGTASLAWVPTELGSSAIVLGLLAHNQSIPSLVDQRLVE